MNKTIRNTFIIICSLFATNTYAVDGVLEINETCATQLGCFSGDTPGYPVTIDGSAGVSYKLTSSLIIPTVDTNGIEITSPSISIDLNGFEIVGLACVGATTNCTPASGTGNGIAASPGYSNISISNGSVTGMGSSGIYLEGDDSAISKVRSRWNRVYGVKMGSDGSLIHSKITGNGGVGTFVDFSVEIIGNIISSNGSRGIDILGGSTISNNNVSDNGADGILASIGSTLTHNTVYNNAGVGIRASNGATITHNTVYNNANDGIRADSGATITQNTAYSNTGDGIQAGDGCAIQKNTMRANTGYGLRLNPTTTYRENVITANTAGTVIGGYNMGVNFCDTNSTCP